MLISKIFPYKVVDLTHSLEEHTPSWNGSCGFKHETKLDYADCPGEVKFRVQQIKMHAGIGTHIDAPAHCISGGITVDQLSLQDLIAPCVVIDVSKHASAQYSLSMKEIEEFEQIHGKIEAGSFVIVRTGWDKFWMHPDKYRNNHAFPSISGSSAEFLLQRNIVGVGIDTLSPDRPESGYPVHGAVLGAGKYIVENIANCCDLPPVGSFILSLPIKAKGCTESAIRCIALIP
jgi:kynurenine formamidase